jgi:LPS export ABC transporter protein LptC
MIERYNIIVKATKIGLISLVALCLVIIGFSSINFKEQASDIKYKLVATKLIEKAEAAAGRPIFSGNGKNSYKISAETITKNTDGLYYMNKISGVYSLENNQNITIASDLGSINNYEDQIILSNDVKIGYEDYVMLSETLGFNLHTKDAASDNFVQIIGRDGSISADKFKTTEEFKKITFDGNVEANFNISSNN